MIVGLDMGGTHIDGVMIKEGKVIQRVKEARDRENLFQSIWASLKKLLEGQDKKAIQRINLSTTISTNAIVEDKIAKVGMFIQSGPGIKNEFSTLEAENVFLSGYVDHRGKEVDPLDRLAIEKGQASFEEKAIEAYGVVGKFSTRNPNHELAVKEMIEKKTTAPVSLGHRMSGKLNFPRRVNTSYLNAAISETFQDFARQIKKSLEREGVNAPVYILKADGGTMNIRTAKTKAVETILSGPAASLSGMNGLLPTEEDAVLLDIGGTTTDIFFLADGVPLFEPIGIKIGKYKSLIRSVYSVSIALGGDSELKVKNKKLEIGPERAGYPLAFGGPKATPTDAMLVLGWMDEGNREQAKAGIANLAKDLSLSTKETAQKILSQMVQKIQTKIEALLAEINSQPVYTIEELLEGKLIKPKRIHLVGGPVKVLAPILEKEMKLPCYYPKDYHVANAIGAALAKTTTEITMLADTSRGMLSVAELGIYERVSSDFDLEDAKKYSLDLLEKSALEMGADQESLALEIIEESSFNMVDGFFNRGKNIRVKAQVKPGLIKVLKGDEVDGSKE
ncbi:MAG: hydantoinase/oxoprolinase family protein [Alkalibacterium sp.]|nr:hydantoinase/oxoprolinase family protein [Alkalibacterium sp.]